MCSAPCRTLLIEDFTFLWICGACRFQSWPSLSLSHPICQLKQQSPIQVPQAWGHVCVGIPGKLFALSLYPTIGLVPLEFSLHIYPIRVASLIERESREPPATGKHHDSPGLCGERTGTLSWVPRAWGGRTKACQVHTNDCFRSSEFWTSRYTIFILFAK